MDNDLVPEIDVLRQVAEAAHEVHTNGAWVEGDEGPEWCISKEVYEMLCDAMHALDWHKQLSEQARDAESPPS